MKYQLYGIDKNGNVTHAGVRECRGPITQNKAKRYQSEWERWRKDYLAVNPGDYPLRSDANDPERKTVSLIIHQCGHAEFAHSYPV